MRNARTAIIRGIRRYGLTVVAVACIAVGAWYVVAPRLAATWQRNEGARHNARILASQQIAVTDSYRFGTPTALSLPRLDLSVEVSSGVYNPFNQSWTLDRTHAFVMSGDYAPATPIIYGHNIAAVFAKLDGAALDEVLRLTFSDGRVLLYRYVGDIVVVPTDYSVLGTSKSHSVFLMTCTGPTFDNRRLLEFQFVGEAPTVTRTTGGNDGSLA